MCVGMRWEDGNRVFLKVMLANGLIIQAAMTIQCMTCKAVFQGTSKQLV